MVGGTGPLDHQLLDALYAADRPGIRELVIAVTNLGEWVPLVLLTLLGAGGLLYRRKGRLAAILVATTLAGRLLVELQKFGVGRLRPEDPVHRVVVKTLSFPSGHAGNSMIVFLSLALLAAPRRFQRLAVAAAVIGAAVIGVTRPMLGVHWPSDVVGGWAFGAAWVLLMLRLAERLEQADTADDHKGRGQ
ncbi:MAG: phosphatase PAP2 family protein [Sphingomicrobium sp.]